MNISANAFVFLGNIQKKNMTWKIYFHIHWLFIVQAIDSVLSWASFISPFHTLHTVIRYIEGFVTSICIIQAGTKSSLKVIQIHFYEYLKES